MRINIFFYFLFGFHKLIILLFFLYNHIKIYNDVSFLFLFGTCFLDYDKFLFKKMLLIKQVNFYLKTINKKNMSFASRNNFLTP